MKVTSADDLSVIVAVIEAESEAYRRRDYEGWARCWVQAPYAGRWIFHADRGLVTMESWAENAHQIRQLMATHPIPETTRVGREAMSIHVGRGASPPPPPSAGSLRRSCGWPG